MDSLKGQSAVYTLTGFDIASLWSVQDNSLPVLTNFNAKLVEKAIDSIDSVLPYSGALLAQTWGAYDALPASFKTAVTNLAKLDSAESTFNAYSPTIRGATLYIRDLNNTRYADSTMAFITEKPQLSVPDGYTIVSMEP